MESFSYVVFSGLLALYLLPLLRARLLLSKAKHPSLRGHVRMAKRVAKLIPYYEFDEERFFNTDAAPADIAAQRRDGFRRLATQLQQRSPKAVQMTQTLLPGISDLQFVSRYRVPFPFSAYARSHLPMNTLVTSSSGVLLCDMDGNKSYDLTGSYGVNVFGNDFYKSCIDAATEKVRDLGPVLGPYHPLIAENIAELKAISGLDEVSFHMSGTEAVMQAVRLARYHTGRAKVVRFCGAYHGWWDEVQPGIGNPAKVGDVYTLKDMDEVTLKVLRARRDIACVLVNPLQALHPNGNAPSDGTLVVSNRAAAMDRERYTQWLQRLREVCTARGIVLILDEIFVGFRIAYRGAQEYFGVQADLVTYGKTLGGGLPIGVVCGRSALMKRFRENRPADICFARGTFNSHPYVMAAMNEFLRRSQQADIQALYRDLAAWDQRAQLWNQRFADLDLPLQIANFSSIFTVLYTRPSRYNWMLQFYLAAEGLTLGWIGTGRLIFSLDYSQQAFMEVVERFLYAAERMQQDGWWWHHPQTTNRTLQRRILTEMLNSRYRLPASLLRS